MSVTAQEIFENAMVLMDSVNSVGEGDTSDNEEYRNRAVPILNLLQQECYLACDTFRTKTAGARPVPAVLADPTDTVALDDALCRNVLPYGLAAHLLLAEGNTAMAAFCNQKYEENLRSFRCAIPAASESVTLVYGGIEYGRDACL